VYGYNRFADTLPSFSGGVALLPHAEKESRVREVLRALGWSEAISSTFTSEEDAKIFAAAGEGAVPMGNPLSAEAGMLRPSLLPGAAGMLALNSTRDVRAVRLFEYGTIFTGSTEEVQERPSLALAAYGDGGASKTIAPGDALFFEMKGAFEELLARFVIEKVSFAGDELPGWIEAGRGARIVLDGETVGWFGELSTLERDRRKLKETAVVGELRLPVLFAHALRQPAAKEPSRYQAVERDFSFLFADTVRWSNVDGALRGLGIAEMISLAPVEIFRDAKGKAVPAGEYSLLLRTVFQSPDRTLREEEISAWQAAIVAALEKLGGRHRAA
jgi:phenylalanyl-tRNA synthetase beta chain